MPVQIKSSFLILDFIQDIEFKTLSIHCGVKIESMIL